MTIELLTCPGCSKAIPDWKNFDAHHRADGTPVKDVGQGGVCEWTRDYLAAEWFRLNPDKMKWSTP